MDRLGSQWRRRAQSPPSCVSVGRGVASWAQGESQVGTLGAGTKRGPHPHTRTGLERAGRTANCFDPGDHSPRRGRDSRRRRLQVGWRASCWTPPRPFPGLWVLETVAMAGGCQFPFLAAEGARPPRWESRAFPVTRVTTKRCRWRNRGRKWTWSRMMENKSNPAKIKL